MAPLNYCERCGRYFTASGTEVKKSATARGPLFDIPDSVCPKCLHPGERYDGDEVVTADELQRRTDQRSLDYDAINAALEQYGRGAS